MQAAIVGIAGPALRPEEAALFRLHPPAGVILFARNILDPAQLRELCAALRATLPPGAVLAVDQEGGRVARLRPPHWRAHPPAAVIGALPGEAAVRAAFLTGALIGLDCAAAGLDLVCAPVLDLRRAGRSDVVGDRSFGREPERVAQLAGSMAAGLLAAGVLPVGKHAPGHGRATVDSHHALPVVPAEADLSEDMEPFRLCSSLPWMMTAHLLYQGVDTERPGTMSPVVIDRMIRGMIGFDGVLVSDDLAMGALDGPPDRRAAGCLAAGCDLALHCSGDWADTEAVLRAVPTVGARTQARMAAGRAVVERARQPLDADALGAEREGLIRC